MLGEFMRRGNSIRKGFLSGVKGQTLIEAVVALAVALVIIGSVVTLVNASNRRANIARQTTQGSKLAQQGVEIVRNIRDVGNNQAVKAGPCLGSPCSWNELYSHNLGGVTMYLQPPSSCAGVNDSWCLVNVVEPTLLEIFHRSVEISDDSIAGFGTPICSEPDTGPPLTYAETKRVTVAVTWQSPTGQTTKTARSCITNWR
jgi:Tfp pilus assembly protein PilV